MNELEMKLEINFGGESIPQDSEILKYFNIIKIEELAAFTIVCINRYGSEELLFEANRVASILVEMMNKRRLINPIAQQSFVDLLIASTLLHNLFFKQEDWTTLYKARHTLLPIAQEMGIAEQVTDAIFQTIESQMGDDSPVPASRPQPNSPTELFAWAIWFAKEYKPQV